MGACSSGMAADFFLAVNALDAALHRVVDTKNMMSMTLLMLLCYFGATNIVPGAWLSLIHI